MVDRRLVARDERQRWERSDKRQVYARFLSASSEMWSGHLLRQIDAEDAYRRIEQLVQRRSELDLVATQQVRAAAATLFDEALNEDQSSERSQAFRRLEETFIEVARDDLGYRR